MLKYIYLLQKCSNHVALVFPGPGDANAKEEERVERYERQLSYVKLMFPDSWQGKRCNAANGMNPEFCGKWKVLAGLLDSGIWMATKSCCSRPTCGCSSSSSSSLPERVTAFSARRHHTAAATATACQQFNRDSSIFVFLISTNRRRHRSQPDSSEPRRLSSTRIGILRTICKPWTERIDSVSPGTFTCID